MNHPDWKNKKVIRKFEDDDYDTKLTALTYNEERDHYKLIFIFLENKFAQPEIVRFYNENNILNVCAGDMRRIGYKEPTTIEECFECLDDLASKLPIGLRIRIRDDKVQTILGPIKLPNVNNNGERYAEKLERIDNHYFKRILKKETKIREFDSSGQMLETYGLDRSSIYGERWGLTGSEADQLLRNRKEGKPWQEC